MKKISSDRVAHRAVLVCCSFLRNYAYYRAMKSKDNNYTNDFLITTQNNFMDISILEWCKCFGKAHNNYYHWRNVVDIPDKFFPEMLNSVGFDEYRFEEYRIAALRQRDKFIAHLDEENIMYIPRLRALRRTITFYYDHIIDTKLCSKGQHFIKSSQFYKHCVRIGRRRLENIIA